MKGYAVLRRGGWSDPDELRDAAARSQAEAERMADDISWLRSYVVAEPDGSLGTVCIYEASSPEAIRAHSERADLPIDEIVGVVETLVVRRDREPAAAEAAT